MQPISDEAAARTLAHALVQEALELAAPGDEARMLARGRAQYAGKVAPGLHELFERVLAEYDY